MSQHDLERLLTFLDDWLGQEHGDESTWRLLDVERMRDEVDREIADYPRYPRISTRVEGLELRVVEEELDAANATIGELKVRVAQQRRTITLQEQAIDATILMLRGLPFAVEPTDLVAACATIGREVAAVFVELAAARAEIKRLQTEIARLHEADQGRPLERRPRRAIGP